MYHYLDATEEKETRMSPQAGRDRAIGTVKQAGAVSPMTCLRRLISLPAKSCQSQGALASCPLSYLDEKQKIHDLDLRILVFQSF